MPRPKANRSVKQQQGSTAPSKPTVSNTSKTVEQKSAVAAEEKGSESNALTVITVPDEKNTNTPPVNPEPVKDKVVLVQNNKGLKAILNQAYQYASTTAVPVIANFAWNFLNTANPIWIDEKEFAAKNLKEPTLVDQMNAQIGGFITANQTKINAIVEKPFPILNSLLATESVKLQRTVTELLQHKDLEEFRKNPASDELKLLLAMRHIAGADPQYKQNTAVQLFLTKSLHLIEALRASKKQFISIMTEIEDEVHVIHVNASEFLKQDPIILTVLDTLIKQGAVKKIHSLYTSPEEALALSAVLSKDKMNALIQSINGLSQEERTDKAAIKNLSDLIALIIETATEPKALAQILGLSAIALAQEHDKVLKELTAQCKTQFSPQDTMQLVAKRSVLVLSNHDINEAVKENQGGLGAYARLEKTAEQQSLKSKKMELIDSSLANIQGVNSWLTGNLPSIPQEQIKPKIPRKTPMKPPATARIEPSKTQIEPHPHPRAAEEPKPHLPAENPVKVQNTPKNSIDITAQERKYFTLLEKFKEVVDELKQRETKETHYATVAQSALELHDKLFEGATQFFKTPSAESFKAFKEHSQTLIMGAEKEFGEQRSVWFNLHPILRGLLGVLAMLTVIPALLVAGISSHGFYDTFFSKPVTNSAKNLALLSSKAEDVNNEIQHGLTSRV